MPAQHGRARFVAPGTGNEGSKRYLLVGEGRAELVQPKVGDGTHRRSKFGSMASNRDA